MANLVGFVLAVVVLVATSGLVSTSYWKVKNYRYQSAIRIGSIHSYKFTLKQTATADYWSGQYDRLDAEVWPINRKADCNQLEGYNISIASYNPKVLLIDNFLSENDCDALVHYIDDCREKSSTSAAPLLQFDNKRVIKSLLPLLATGAALLACISGDPQASDEAGHVGATQVSVAFLHLLKAYPAALAKVGSFILVIYAASTAFLSLYFNSNDKNALRTSRMIQLQDDLDSFGPAHKAAFSAAQRLVSKAEDLMQTTSETFERPTLTLYQKGQHFSTHQDASVDIAADGWADLGGQRLVTLITYLNTVSEQGGGATVFDHLGISVRPKQGRALLFFPAGVDGKLDKRMLHHGQEAVEDKYIVQIWKRQQTVPPPLGWGTTQNKLS